MLRSVICNQQLLHFKMSDVMQLEDQADEDCYDDCMEE